MSPLPRLLSLATAVPPHTVPQDLVVNNAMRLFDRDRSEIRRMLSVFGNAGIEHRYSCVPGEWYLEPHGWVERSRLFVEHAVTLLAEATRRCVAQTGLGLDDIDGVVAVSTTGVATPSLDALVIEIEDRLGDPSRVARELQLRLGLKTDVRSVPLGSLPRFEGKGKRFFDQRHTNYQI